MSRCSRCIYLLLKIGMIFPAIYSCWFFWGEVHFHLSFPASPQNRQIFLEKNGYAFSLKKKNLTHSPTMWGACTAKAKSPQPLVEAIHMVHILHTVDGSKSQTTTWHVKNPVNIGINYLLTGAGFLPSTVFIINSQQQMSLSEAV